MKKKIKYYLKKIKVVKINKSIIQFHIPQTELKNTLGVQSFERTLFPWIHSRYD